MTGFEFLEAATEALGDSFAKIVFVLLTTSINPDDEERARQFPVVKEYIHKPLQKEHLDRVV
jgi:CheY-like chemotaxis protein